MTTKSELEMMRLQAKDHQLSPEGRKEVWDTSPSQSPAGINPANILISPAGLQACERINFSRLSHPVWGTFCRSPRKLTQDPNPQIRQMFISNCLDTEADKGLQW